MVERASEIAAAVVEHGFGGSTRRGFVKLTIIGPGKTLVAVDQMLPDAARNLANDLLASAARAEHEQDLVTELTRPKAVGGAGMTDETAGIVLVAVRHGEQRRHEKHR